MKVIAKLEPVALRAVWAHEAHDFTHWLADNLDLISETIGAKLSFVSREAAAGPFSADILAEDEEGNQVVIENQLALTDHDHLGKLITYMSNFEAKTAIWVTSDPRPEHEKAIHWLNETLPEDTSFYLLKLEAFRIGASDPAPRFSIVAGPTTEARAVGKTKKEMAERHVLRHAFWEQLLEKCRKKTSLFANISPGKENWISATAGRGGFGFNFVVLMKETQVELYIDTGDQVKNKAYFDALLAHKSQIESSFRASLLWQRLDDKRASRIRYVADHQGLLNRDGWQEIQDKAVDAMIRLSDALKSEIKAL